MLQRAYSIVITIVSIVFVLTCASGEFTSAYGQQIEDEWSPVVRMPSDVYTRWTKIISGPDNRLHAFWAAAEPDDQRGPYTSRYETILYASSIDGMTWSEPSDIIFDSFGIDDLDVVTSADGFHLFWNSDCIRSAQAGFSADLQDAKNWVGSDTCTASRSIPDSLAVVSDKTSGEIYLVFSSGETLNVQTSTDNALNWSPPEVIAGASESGNAVNTAYPSAFVDNRGSLFVAWSGVKSSTENYEITGVFFARSEDGGTTWTIPLQLAGPGNTEPAVVTNSNGDTHVVWNTLVGLSLRLHVWSADDGQTWSAVTDILNSDPYRSSAGKQGTPGIVVEGDDAVAVLLGTNAGVRYSKWLDGAWAQALHLGSLGDGETWATGLVISGNTLLCAYWNAYDAPNRGFSISCKGSAPDPVNPPSEDSILDRDEPVMTTEPSNNSQVADSQHDESTVEVQSTSPSEPASASAGIPTSPPARINEWAPVAWGAGLSLLAIGAVVFSVVLRARKQ